MSSDEEMDDLVFVLLSAPTNAKHRVERSCREKAIFKARRQQGQYHTQYQTLRAADDGSFEQYVFLLYIIIIKLLSDHFAVPRNLLVKDSSIHPSIQPIRMILTNA